MINQFIHPSPVGFLRVVEEEEGIKSLSWYKPPARSAYTPVLQHAQEWIEDYFQGFHRPVDFPLRSSGSDFQMKVWLMLLQIPAGEVTSYGDIAKALNTSPRAVGSACRANPLAIIVPCHRVVASDGSLGGYSGGKGTETKLKLLKHENAIR